VRPGLTRGVARGDGRLEIAARAVKRSQHRVQQTQHAIIANVGRRRDNRTIRNGSNSGD
jgi:hypothetical protein